MELKRTIIPIITLILINFSTCKECQSDEVILNCTLSDLTVIPSSWNNSNFLTVDLSRNDISRLDQFPPSNSIQKLILAHNNISEIVNKAFCNLNDLKFLDLSFNYLQYDSLSPIVFQGIDKITEYAPIYVEVLKLSHNALHALDSKLFEHLPNLTELYLDHNPFNVLDSVTVLAITNAYRNLKILDLSYCGLQKIPQGFLHTLSQLKILILNGNQFVTVSAAFGEASKSLISLSLNDNLFEDVTFPEMKYLEELNISETDSLRFIRNGSFKSLPALQILRCNHNALLGEIQEYIFDENANISQLEFRGNALQSLPEHIGVPWESIAEVDVRGNPWNCDCHLGWFAQTLLPQIINKHPMHINALRCASPDNVAGVPLVQMSLRACVSANSLRRRVTALLAILCLLVVCGVILGAGQWAKRYRRPPFPRGGFGAADMEDSEDVVHYVRIVNSVD